MKKFLFGAAAAVLLCTSAVASQDAGVPQLSGGYLLTLINNCVESGSSVSQTTAAANFDTGTGILSFKGFVADGNPLFLIGVSGSGPYSNTKTTVTFDNITYKAFYGAVKQGVAQSASLIALVNGASGTCANQVTLVHQ